MNKGSTSIKTTPNNIPKIPKVLILVGKTLQFISPRLATRFAISVFSTPIRFKIPEREKVMAKSAQKELITIPSINKEVQVYTYGYSNKKVLLVHGWSGRNTQFFKIADSLLENGFMTIGFDAPAHGNSPGKTTLLLEFIATIKFLEEKHGPFEIAIGHSLGGMAILNASSKFLKIKKAVIIGSGNKITHIVEDFVAKMKLKKTMVAKIKKHFFNKYGEEMDSYSSDYVAKDINIPILVVHDTKDLHIPVSSAYAIRKNLKNGQLLITNELGHTRILKDNSVIARTLDFILKSN